MSDDIGSYNLPIWLKNQRRRIEDILEESENHMMQNFQHKNMLVSLEYVDNIMGFLRYLNFNFKNIEDNIRHE